MAHSPFGNASSRPIKRFLLGEFLINISRGYLLVLFTQLLFRESGTLWHNLIYILSEVLFSFIVPLFAGIWVDKSGPGRLLLLATISMSFLALMSAFLTDLTTVSVGVILFISILNNILNAAVRLGIFTLTPSLTSNNTLIQMNGWQQVAFQGGNLIGVLLSGLLMDKVPASASFLLTGALMLGATYGYAGAIKGIKKQDVAAPRQHFFTMVPLLRRSPMLVMLIILGASDLVAINLFNLLLPIITHRYFHGQSTALSLMDACFTSGAIFMGWFAGKKAIKGRRLHRYMLAMPIAMVAAISQSIFFNAPFCFVIMIIMGFLVASYTVYFSATIQALIPPTLRGRFAALRRMISTLVVMLATFCFTFSFQSFGAPGILSVSLLLAVLIIICGVIWMRYRQESPPQNGDDYHDLRALVLPFEQLTHSSKESVNA